MSKTVVHLDASGMAMLAECPYRWYTRYVENLVPVQTKTTAADKGTIGHRVLDCYYRMRAQDGNPLLILPQINAAIEQEFKVNELKEEFANTIPKDDEYWEILPMRLILYAFKYTKDFSILKNEKGDPGIELGFSKVLYEDDRYLFIVDGRIDVLAMTGGIKLFMDHKFQTRRRTLYGPSTQFMTYAWATGFDRCAINYISLVKTFDRNNTFRREIQYFSETRLRLWEIQMMEYFRTATSILEIGPSAHRKLSACGGHWNSNKCGYTPICEAAVDGRTELMPLIKIQNYKKQVWEPWKLAEEEEEHGDS